MMVKSAIPVGAEPENIGKVVSIQIFTRSIDRPGEILEETLTKYVGVLQSYYLGEVYFDFTLAHTDTKAINTLEHHVEIIPVSLLQ